uniref:Putative secreted protein n=1 Tax=Ornithodoros turicata TaxID=34597 RepID=A0A2R5LF10_9ACAR
MLDILLGMLSLVISLLLLLVLVGVGWYIVWKLFLSRFKFVRELLIANNGATDVQATPRSRSRRARVD